jgi:phytoene/squalene synthetase
MQATRKVRFMGKRIEGREETAGDASDIAFRAQSVHTPTARMNHITVVLKQKSVFSILAPAILAPERMPSHARPGLRALLDFAEGIHRIACDDFLPTIQRRRRLDQMETAFSSRRGENMPAFAAEFAEMSRLHPPLLHLVRSMLSAALEDTVRLRVQSEAQWRDYAKRRAGALGRCVYMLCGEKEFDANGCDAFHQAFQLLAHLREAREDYTRHERVYLPLEWFGHAGCDLALLGEARPAEPLLRVFAVALKVAEGLLEEARPFVPSLRFATIRLETLQRLAFMRAVMKRGPLHAEKEPPALARYAALLALLPQMARKAPTRV